MHTYIHIYIYTCIHAYIYTYIHTYIHACIDSYVRAYIHTYMHTYIYQQQISRLNRSAPRPLPALRRLEWQTGNPAHRPVQRHHRALCLPRVSLLLRPRGRRLRTLHRCQALPAAAWRRRTDLHLLMPVVWKLCQLHRRRRVHSKRLPIKIAWSHASQSTIPSSNPFVSNWIDGGSSRLGR